jgi:hypothetical protein
MKTFKMIYKWVIISILFQVLFFLFLNNYYLVRDVDIKASSYDVVDEKPKEDKGIKVSSDAKDIKVSFDGAYAAYLLNGNIEFLDIKSKKTKDVIKAQKGEIDYYKWLPDRNIIIYSEKSMLSKSSSIQIFTKDIDSGLDHSFPKITGLAKNSEIQSIELSPLTNVVYAKVKSGSSQAKIYKFNIMDQSSFIMSVDADTSIEELSYKDILLYEDKRRNRVRAWDGINKHSWPLPFKEKIVLLGIDAEDKIYIGEIDDNEKISKIYYGNLDEESHESWQEVVLKEAAEKSRIVISGKGHIFLVDSTKEAIKDLKSGSEVTYKGSFVEVIDNYVVYIDKNKLNLDVIN